MTLIAELEVTRGDFALDAQIRVGRGETLALLGPNGSGKSTLLATIAGLLVPRRGRVEVDGRVLTRVDATGQTLSTPPNQRRIGLLGQEPLLFPHLSALENVAFGLRSRGRRAVRGIPAVGSRDDSARGSQGSSANGSRATTAHARAHAHRWLDDVGLAGLSARKPAELSGGQQQRVAIARALAAEPDVVLLDEPLAALDVETAVLIRALLRERLAEADIATVIVTHDVVDALVLADRVAILDNGHILDIGAAADVLGRPTNRFAAALAGLNLVEGTREAAGVIRLADGRQLRADDESSRGANVGDAVTAVFPPSAIRITTAASRGGDESTWFATVARFEPAVRGVRVTFVADDITAECSAAALLAHGIREGATVSVSVDPAFVTVYRTRSPLGVMG